MKVVADVHADALSGEDISRLSSLPPVPINVVVLVAPVFERREDSSEVKGTRSVLMSHCPSYKTMHAVATTCETLVMTFSLGSLPVDVDATLEPTPLGAWRSLVTRAKWLEFAWMSVPAGEV